MNILEKLRKESGFAAAEVAEYLGVTEEEYDRLEQSPVNSLDVRQLERIADLYHVEPYDILTGTAVSKAVADTPRLEAELIPFFRMVRNYVRMQRLLQQAAGEQYNLNGKF